MILIYVLANIAYLSVLDVNEIRSSKLVAADVAERLIGRKGVIFVSVTVMLSTFGTLSSVLLTSPRILFAMADDKLFFKQVAKVHPKFGTPYVAVMLVAAMGIAFVLLQTFEKLTDTYVIAVLPFYALGVAAVFPLRKKPGYAPSFKTPGYPVVPLLFIASTIFLLGNSVVEPDTRIWTLGIFAVILAGIPFYWFVAKGRNADRG